jgi:hypothetical protein
MLSIRRSIAHHHIHTVTNWLALISHPEKYGGAEFYIGASDSEMLRDKDITPLMIADLMRHQISVESLIGQFEHFYAKLLEHTSKLPQTTSQPPTDS